ncbi:AMP-binding protein [Nocardia sp. NPDC059239]|uniref:AMP-binding protein n=1 Tax=Nocardia sp. NPDC059239 TaxID=3346785 RepID=UPI0036C9AA61
MSYFNRDETLVDSTRDVCRPTAAMAPHLFLISGGTMRSQILLTAVHSRSAATPNAVAIRIGDEQIGYQDLTRRIAANCAEFDRIPLPPHAPIGFVTQKTPETIALILGGAAAGHPPFLPAASLGAAALTRALDTAGAAGLAQGSAATGVTLERRSDPGEPADRCTAIIFTTSGSTGTPKVVPLPETGVNAFLQWAIHTFDIGRESVVLSLAPLNFDLSLLDIWATLFAGGTVVLPKPDSTTDGAYLAGLIRSSRPTVIQTVPFFIGLISDALSEEVDRSPFGSVQKLILTGDRVAPAVLGRLPQLFPNAEIYNVYGCTETNDSYMHRITEFNPGPGEGIPIGVPIAGVQARILDPTGTEISGAGTGELLVHTPFQAAGYADPAIDTDRFVRRGADVFFRTGDIVTRDEQGVVRLEGRSDWLVKVRGARTNIQEVEAVLASHPLVDEVAVIARPHAVEGHRLHAEIRSFGGRKINSLEARTHCAAALPVTAIPSTFGFGDTPLPRTTTGKVDRGRLTVRP